MENSGPNLTTHPSHSLAMTSKRAATEMEPEPESKTEESWHKKNKEAIDALKTRAYVSRSPSRTPPPLEPKPRAYICTAISINMTAKGDGYGDYPKPRFTTYIYLESVISPKFIKARAACAVGHQKLGYMDEGVFDDAVGGISFGGFEEASEDTTPSNIDSIEDYTIVGALTWYED
jgi:hypothetical protein